jgi:hypothetical protein
VGLGFSNKCTGGSVDFWFGGPSTNPTFQAALNPPGLPPGQGLSVSGILTWIALYLLAPGASGLYA